MIWLQLWCIYPLLCIQKVNLSSPTPLQLYFTAFFYYSIFSSCLFFSVLSSGFSPLSVHFFLVLLQPFFSFIPVVSSDSSTLHNFHITKYSTDFSHRYCSSHSCPCMKNVSFPSSYFQISIPMLFSSIIHLNSSVMNSQLLINTQLPTASTNVCWTSSLITTFSWLIWIFCKELLQQ